MSQRHAYSFTVNILKFIETRKTTESLETLLEYTFKKRYRQFSLTSVIYKLLERIFGKRRVEVLEKMITHKQLELREGRCLLPLKDDRADCVYIDFKKAFDKVSHRRLSGKLEHLLGVKNRLLECMKDHK